ncbi:MAG TPA: alpha/beta fold hydrolase [Longimicrobiaceae bacterium]|nr:alpha/beta fold hydrolase [Longimicrobiaceae bacterium]
MKIRNLLLAALPLLAACEQGAPLGPSMSPIDTLALRIASPVDTLARSAPIDTLLRAPVDTLARSAYRAPVREGYLTGADGVQLYYKTVGTGPDTVVVLHGGPGMSMGYLDRDLTPLAHGRTVIFYDQRGGGRSQLVSDPAQLSLDRHLADLEAVRAQFGLTRMKLVGHSWGALLAGFYAREHADRLEKLVLLNPAPPSAALWGEFEATVTARMDPATAARINEIAGLWFAGQVNQALCQEFLELRFATYFADPANMSNLRGGWCDVTDAVAAGLLPTHLTILGSLGAWDLGGELGHVAAPTLVVHGAADAVPFASSQGFAAAIPGARLRVMENVGHFPWMEAPVPFFTELNNFLRREGGL